MATVTLTPAQQLNALLIPTTDEGQRAIQNDKSGLLKEQSERYQKALRGENSEQFKLTLGDITRKLVDAGHLDNKIAAKDVIDTFDFRPLEERPQAPEETPPPDGGDWYKALHPGGSQATGGAPDYKQKLLDKLKETQKSGVMQELDQILATTTDSADLARKLDDFFHNNLTAVGVLGNEYKILLAQTKKLYGKNADEFNSRTDALQKQAEGALSLLKQTTQIGPVQDSSLQEQRDREVKNKNALVNVMLNKKDLRREVGRIFDDEWAKRQMQNDLVRGFRQALEGVGFNYYDYSEGYDAIASTTVVTEEVPQEEPEPIPQEQPGTTPGKQGGKGGQIRKTVGKEAEQGAKRLGKQVLKTGGEQVGKAVATEAGEAIIAGTSEFWGPILAGIAIAALVIFSIAAIILLCLLLFGGKFQASQAGSSSIAANAKRISDNLCKTTVENGITIQQRCESSSGDLFDNINPGAVFPQPKARFPFLDFQLQNSQFGIQFIQPSGKTYWAYNRPFCTGNCFPWDYRGWGRYWCTDLVIDSYASAGFTDIVGWSDPDFGYTHGWDTGNTSVMIKFFARNKGYSFMPTSQFNPSKLASGSAIFFKWDSNPNLLGEHTGIVSSVQIDPNHPGFGVVNTLEANAWNKTGHYSFRNNNPGNQIVGFGIKTQ